MRGFKPAWENDLTMGSAKKKKQPKVVTDQLAFVRQPQKIEVKGYYYLAFILLVAPALLYGHSLKYPLIFDDLYFFTPANLSKLGSVLFQPDLRWFSYASFGWTYKLFDLDWTWYRLGNLGLHIFTGLLLFVFFSRLQQSIVQSEDILTRPRLTAFFAALIFVLHPVAVYGVAYLVQRSIIMATLFAIASLLCYLEGLIRNKSKWFILSALFYFLAVFSKEHSIMLPGVAAALTLLLHKPSLGLAKKICIPFALYLIIGTIIILLTKGLLGAVYEPQAAIFLERVSEQQETIQVANAYLLSVITQGYLFFKYLFIWIIPYTGEMSLDIRQPLAEHLLSWPHLPGFVLFLLYPILAIKLLLKRGRIGLVGFGLLFPWLLYLTELSTVRIQEPFVLYRSYLWMSGLPIVLCAVIGAAPKKLVFIFLGAGCVILAGLAWTRLDTFSDPVKIWTDAIEKVHDTNLLGVGRMYNNRGMAYLDLGELQKARADFVKAAALSQQYPQAYLNIGVVNFRLKNFQEALQNYNKALEMKPDLVMARINRSNLFLQTGRYADALKDCEYAMQLDAQNTDAYLNCSHAHLGIGETQEALRYLDTAIKINPRLVAAYINRSVIKSAAGNNNSALNDLEQALSIDPTNARLYYHRGIILGAMGRYQEAMKDYTRAIEIKPNYADAYTNRGSLHRSTQQLSEAMADFNYAIQFDPNQINAYINRGHIFASLSRFEDALINYDKALKLNPNNGQALLNRGAVLLALNKSKEAMESFRKSCAVGEQQGCKIAANAQLPQIYAPRKKPRDLIER